MATILSSIGSFITASTNWVGTVVGQITAEGNELLLVFVLTSFVGIGIGLVKRLIRL